MHYYRGVRFWNYDSLLQQSNKARCDYINASLSFCFENSVRFGRRAKRGEPKLFDFSYMVPRGRVELPRDYSHQLLRLARLPFRHLGMSVCDTLKNCYNLIVSQEHNQFAGIVYRYYASLPRTREGSDSPYPLHSSLKLRMAMPY